MIKFNQPRYILPLIALPFIYVFYFMYDYAKANKPSTISAEALAKGSIMPSINHELPDPFLDKDNLKDKFDAFQEVHKNNRDYSAIQEIDRREEQVTQQGMPDRMQDLQQIPTPHAPTIPGRTSHQRSMYPKNPTVQESDYESQMRLFKAQMSYMDSLFSVEEEKGKSGDEGERVKTGDGRQKLEEESGELNHSGEGNNDVVKKLQPADKTVAHRSNFNTILTAKTQTNIKAIIDEEQKVKQDSRIRLRLLEDVPIGEHHLPKGHYLYGLVSAFRAQRVEIHISSLLLNGQIHKVAIDIYDLDGMKGLYVPASRFRELGKTVGEDLVSGQQLHLDQAPGNQTQLMYDMASDAFNSTARATSKAFRSNKAKIKYNTQVYLVNTK